MSINTLEYAQIFTQALDKKMVADATTGWMEGNSGNLPYTGGKTVKVPKTTMSGLGNYDRSTGFPQGSATLNYESKTMTQDRGVTFGIDSMDVDETNFVMNASMLMGEFQKTQVIPEIDAYRYMTIAQAAIANSRAAGGYTPVVADILTKLRADIAAVQDVIGSGIPLVISMPISVLNVLENSTELTKQLNVGAFQPNVDLTYSVKKVDECPIIEVPSARMKTNFAFFDARTGGQAIGGFAPAGKAGVTIGDVRYDAAAVGTNGNAYTVTIVQGTGVSATTAGVIDSSGNLVITLGTTSGSVPLSVTAAQIAALSFSGAGAALITATALLAGTVQAVTAAKTMVGGAGAGDAAKSINWLITAANAPIAISKTNNMRIFAPDVNQTLDAWKIDYRKYHDLWILDNKLSTIFANIKESL